MEQNNESLNSNTTVPDANPIEKKDNVEQKPEQNQESNSELQIEIEIPQDARTIWAIQRFFLFSLVVMAIKIYLNIRSDFYVAEAISTDAILDAIVSGLGIYLIQWQRDVLKKVKDGTQNIEVNKNGTIIISSIQGFILFIGGLVVLIKAITLFNRYSLYGPYYTPIEINGFDVMSGLILSTIISLKLIYYFIHKKDADETDNLALKSISENLLIDIFMNTAAWLTLVITAFWYYPWIYMDAIVGIIIGAWMILSGLKYIKPLFEVLAEAIKNAELNNMDDENSEENEDAESNEENGDN